MSGLSKLTKSNGGAVLPSMIQDASYIYAEDAEASDAYAITLVPAIIAYVTGQIFTFKANTANTGASSLNVNGLGAKTLKKSHDQDTETGEIESGSIVTVAYDGTNFQILSVSAVSASTPTDGVQVVFVGKHGNDSNDGLTFDKAKLTFNSAITTASAMTPTTTNRISIICSDSGNYAETSVVTLPQYVNIQAPQATLRPSDTHNTIQLSADTSINFFRIIQDQGGSACIVGANDTGEKFVNVRYVQATGASVALINYAVTSAGTIHAKIEHIDVETGTGVSDNSAGGHTHIDIGSIVISGNSGKAIFNGNASSNIVGTIEHIKESGTPTTTIGIDVDAGEVSLYVGELLMDTAYDVASGATLYLTAGEMSGTQTNAGTAKVSVAGKLAVNLELNDNSIEIEAMPTDDTETGIVTSVHALGATIAVGELVYLGSAGKWLKADASAVATCGGMLGICLVAGDDTDPTKVLLSGYYRDDSQFDWTIGDTIYASETAGDFTATAPSTTDALVRVMGFAVSADVLYFNPSPDHITVV